MCGPLRQILAVPRPLPSHQVGSEGLGIQAPTCIHPCPPPTTPRQVRSTPGPCFRPLPRHTSLPPASTFLVLSSCRVPLTAGSSAPRFQDALRKAVPRCPDQPWALTSAPVGPVLHHLPHLLLAHSVKTCPWESAVGMGMHVKRGPRGGGSPGGLGRRVRPPRPVG